MEDPLALVALILGPALLTLSQLRAHRAAADVAQVTTLLQHRRVFLGIEFDRVSVVCDHVVRYPACHANNEHVAFMGLGCACMVPQGMRLD